MGLLLVPALLPAPLAAQGGAWPTLAESGLEYISQSGLFQVSLSGQLDLEAVDVGASWSGLVGHQASEGSVPDQQILCLRCHVGAAEPGGGGTLAAHRLRLFADIFLTDHLYSLIEVRSDRGHAPSDGPTQVRVEQAYVRASIGTGSFGLQLGRFASPFGSYPQRHLSVVDPFLRPPLPYDYRTVMSRTLVPREPQPVVNWKDAPRFIRKIGAPPVWDVPYQWGAMAMGSFGALDLRLAAVNSATSSDPDAWDFQWERLGHPSLVAGARVKPSASLEVGLSYSRGPWMEGFIREFPPPGWTPPSRYALDQEIVSIDFAFARGPMMLRGEAMVDRWAVPEVDVRPTEWLYSLELQWDLWAGVSAAARAGYIDFRPFTGDRGLGRRPDDWDYDVYRYEASLGYRLVRNAGILLSAYRQIQRVAEDGDTHLLGARAWYAF